MATKKLSPAQERELRRCSDRDVKVRGSLEKTYSILLERELVKRSGFLLYTITDAGREYLAALEPQQPASDIDPADDAWIAEIYPHIAEILGIPTPDGDKPDTEVMNADVATPAQYFSAKQQLIDTLKGEADTTTRDGIKLQIETLEAEWYNPPAPAFMMDEPPVSPEDTELAPAAPEMPDYEPLQPKVIIPVRFVSDPIVAQLETRVLQLTMERDDALQQVADRLKEVFELQRKVLSYSMAQTTPAPMAAVKDDVTLVDEITVSAVLPGRGGSLVFVGNFTEDIESGVADATNKVGNIGAWWEHKVCLSLAGYRVSKHETMIGARLLPNKDRNRRIKAVRSLSANEWFSYCETNELKPGDVVIDETTKVRRTVKKVVKDTSQSLYRGEDHYTVIFESGEDAYKTRSMKWFLVWTPEKAQQLAA